MKISMYTDGAARGNPGPAGIGVVIYDDNNAILDEYCAYLGTATNNEAEYRALIAGLERAARHVPCSLSIFMDSELVARQMNGVYRVKHPNLIGLFETARAKLSAFEKVIIAHIPREKNKAADRMANKAIDTASPSNL